MKVAHVLRPDHDHHVGGDLQQLRASVDSLRALGITRADDTADLVTGERIWIAKRAGRVRIATSARVGVAYAGAWADQPWRFFDPTSPHVSKPPAKAIGRGSLR